jgi:serine/threonine-protein kinase
MPTANAEQRFRDLCAQQGVDPVAVDPEETGTLSTGPQEAQARVRAAAEFQLRVAEHFVAGLDIGEPIGRGGHAVIRSARQIGLRREVAVKEPLPDARDQNLETMALLREAWIAGGLEHPNIVPVYTLGQSPEGKPLLVMKRIEGRTWRALLAEPHFTPPDGRDLLEYHIQVFMAVCHAVSFAHAKGIVHRDIKPANVMLGHFGEVYLLDWGLAVTLRDDAHPAIPRARNIQDVAGTPVYLAPEMAEGRGDRIDERTDVFLLGATLHQVATGTRRHSGTDMPQVLANALRCEPYPYPAHIPRELAAICQRATSRDPADRYQNPEELRRAVQGFLAHRGATHLADDARTELEMVRELSITAELPPEAERRLYTAFSACRFGFQQALREWPEHLEATDGLQAGLELMIGYELGRGALDAARALCRELPRPRPDLEARIAEAARAEQSEMARLKNLAHAVDTRVEAGLRTFHAVILGLSWLLGHLLVAWLDTHVYPVATADYLAAGVFYLGVVVCTTIAQRRRLFTNQANREFTLGLVAVGVIYVFALLTATWLSWPVHQALITGLLTFATVGLLGTIVMEAWLAPGTLFVLAGVPLIGIWPAWGFEIVGGVGAAVFGVLALAWRRFSARR